MSRPNVLWICTDSQRWDTLGCYGNPFVHTPVVDRLAAEGVLFENAFVQNPLCTPSRGSFLTGRYPSTTRLRQNGQLVPPDLRPITRTMADQGYLCGLSGKLHLSACDRRTTFGPEWFNHPKKDWDRPFEQRVDDGYTYFEWSHSPGHRTPNNAYFQWLHQKGMKPEQWAENRPSGHSDHVYHGPDSERHQARFCVDKAIEFIELHAAFGTAEPWVFSVNPFDPHPSYNPPRDYLERYLPMVDEIPLPAWEEGELDRKPAYQKERYESGKAHSTLGWSDRDKRLVKAAYWAMCDHLDAQVGRLLEALERSGQRENTLVIFTSDHGDLLGDHGKTVKGPYLYEGALRVPLVLHFPGVLPAGRRISDLVELTDLAPTLLDYCGLPKDPSMQGRSLRPLIEGPHDGPWREDVYAEYYNSNPDNPPLWLGMVRTRAHKLVAVHGSDEGELYDLGADPGECRNLWDDPAHRDLKERLCRRLAARQVHAAADPLPPRVGVF